MAKAAPAMGATMYIQRCSVCPETIAGDRLLIGFMLAPQIGPANIASNKTVEPMASPANMPCSLLPVATLIMTSIRKKVRMNSKIKDCNSVPVGSVAPNVSLVGNKK